MAPISRNSVSALAREPQCPVRLARRQRRFAKLAMSGRRQLIMEFWSIVVGAPPPVPNVQPCSEGELTCLAEAHALFRGIERPYAQDDYGANILAYVLKPKIFYEYDPGMVRQAVKAAVPEGFVFVTYARVEHAVDGPQAIRGTITHWSFVRSGEDPWLPIDHSSRYRQRVW